MLGKYKSEMVQNSQKLSEIVRNCPTGSPEFATGLPLGALWGPFDAHWAASGQALARESFECLRGGKSIVSRTRNHRLVH